MDVVGRQRAMVLVVFMIFVLLMQAVVVRMMSYIGWVSEGILVVVMLLLLLLLMMIMSMSMIMMIMIVMMMWLMVLLLLLLLTIVCN